MLIKFSPLIVKMAVVLSGIDLGLKSRTIGTHVGGGVVISVGATVVGKRVEGADGSLVG